MAIPQWVIEGKNSGWILGVYGLVFGGLMPWLVVSDIIKYSLWRRTFAHVAFFLLFQGKWWFGTRQYTKDGALNATAATFFHRLEETSTVPELVAILACSTELGQKDKADAPAKAGSKKSKKEVKAEVGGLEGLVKAVAAEHGVEGVMSGRYESLQSRRSAAIIWSHLLRIEFGEVALREGESHLPSRSLGGGRCCVSTDSDTLCLNRASYSPARPSSSSVVDPQRVARALVAVDVAHHHEAPRLPPPGNSALASQAPPAPAPHVRPGQGRRRQAPLASRPRWDRDVEPTVERAEEGCPRWRTQRRAAPGDGRDREDVAQA